MTKVEEMLRFQVQTTVYDIIIKTYLYSGDGYSNQRRLTKTAAEEFNTVGKNMKFALVNTIMLRQV